jgi:cell division protein FtsQ
MVAAVRGQAYRGSKPQQRPAAPRSGAPKPRSKSTVRPVSKFRGGGAGLPPHVALICAASALVLAGGVALFTGGRLKALESAIGHGAANVLAHAGFRLTSLKINGASPIAAADIAQATGLSKDTPTLSIDLAALRDRVRQVGWVQEATVTRLLPATIVVNVKARNPVAVWQSNGIMQVVDSTGKVIPEASPDRFPDLPLLVGVGANSADSSVMGLVRARPRLASRLEALVRVDERRWDLRLKDGSIIQLPAVGEDEALIQLDKLDGAQHLLDLGFERIDLRTPDMVVVRRGAGTAAAAAQPVVGAAG